MLAALYMSRNDLRGVRPQGMSNGTAIVHTAVRSLQIYSDRETTDSVLHLLVLKVILEIGWDVAFNQDQGPIYRAKIRKNTSKNYMKCVGLR